MLAHRWVTKSGSRSKHKWEGQRNNAFLVVIRKGKLPFSFQEEPFWVLKGGARQ